ncbi:hypothetical protein [Methylobacterium trifolii]|uniref:Uncharacterized protein n=1 Tax=Methylobacterium trifolii TaxID=1003092 RepID=A0ABQ4U0E9_9HYPH|nr:hypothetical protein [Methylobacterium trifolii]GJE59595.1 hypothetical protein MPOCJGCO_1691 [Methylobacterium trifolii]
MTDRPPIAAVGTAFFAGLHTGWKATERHTAFLSALDDLQDAPGDLDEIATGHEILDERAGTEAGSPTPAQ